MLEKIGLPPKPSLRGNNWVVDATHCQGCSSQFTFINRKHHCRRCGGIFCNSCTQQRMFLRGQGDSPVRICEPCKKLEEAARFEMRYGHKNKAGRGGTKLTTKHEDEVINQILGSEGTALVSSKSASSTDMLSRDQQATSHASSSSFQEVSSHDDRGDVLRSLSHGQGLDFLTEVGSVTPEELRQQALEEKKKYKTLKAEGKPEEALRAFKRGKELEKQAGTLEMQLRKNRRKALSSSHASELSSIKDESKASARDNKLPAVKSKAKDDLAADLRELGWSDMDLHNADKKPISLSLEGELSTLIGEVSQRTNTGKGNHGIDKSQVIAHKKKALELKREGKLAEAKEELKKAKVLEKQIEEQELLGDDEDSDEEFSSLLRSLNDNKHDDSSFEPDLDRGFDFDPLVGLTDDIGTDRNLEVTEEDMGDQEIAAALKSLGWNEETTHSEDLESQFAAPHTESLSNKIQSLKKEALDKKRAGNTAEALALLKKAKLLEKDLYSSDSQELPNVSNVELINVNERKDWTPHMASKSKLMIQKELLGLKKRALALRREGKLDEAEEELKKGNVLEKQLEEMDNAPKVIHSRNMQVDSTMTMINDVGDEGEVTDQDMNDPTYLSLLKNIGWEDDKIEHMPIMSSEEAESATALTDTSTATLATTNIQDRVSRKSKGEIQRELLGLKRKSLALRRQGDAEEAEEVLKIAKVLEAQLIEIEEPVQKEVPAEPQECNDALTSCENANLSFHLESKQSPVEDLCSTGLVTPERPEEIVGANEKPKTYIINASQQNVSQNDGNSLQQDVLAHKRRAVALKREGKLAEAKEELRQAKLLEKHMEEKNSQPSTSSTNLSSSDVSSVHKKESTPNSGPKTLSSRDRFKLQQESLNHKRQALKLRREGRTEEADAEFELAKSLELQLEDSTTHDSMSSSENAAEPVGEVTVEDFLDPQLLSALKAIGLQDASSGSQVLEISELKEHVAAKKSDKSSQERMLLEEQIKAEKLKALNFKRSGKQADALDALRRAKHFEKKLSSLTT